MRNFQAQMCYVTAGEGEMNKKIKTKNDIIKIYNLFALTKIKLNVKNSKQNLKFKL